MYGVEVSLKQYMTFSTEKPEKRALERYLSLHGEYRKALDAFISDFQAANLSLSEFIKKVNLNQ